MSTLTPSAIDALERLRGMLRPASIATLGGFRPPEDPTTSWFGRAVALPGEGFPVWDGEPMPPLLQIRVSELPYVPDALTNIALLVLFHNAHRYPFDAPQGEGWTIREYGTLDGLVPLDTAVVLPRLKPFPIRWSRIEDDAPGWEDAWGLIDLTPVNECEAASDAFFDDFSRYSGTKVGGFPKEIQHGVGVERFVFQVGSEEKANWMWADNGIGYFFRDEAGRWSWSCQFY